MRDLTLRQVEVIRAVMMTGTISGAADLLNVSAPGISRLVKHTEESLGVRLFERKAGLFQPAPEAGPVFEQIHQIYEKMSGLSYAITRLRAGTELELAFASAPSIANCVVPRAIARIRRRYPELHINLDLLRFEETVDYLLLERGEFVAFSYLFEHPSLEFTPLGTGEVIAILPEGHRLATAERISVRELAGESLIGVGPSDPYGQLMEQPFRMAGMSRRLAIRVRFAQTTVGLVQRGIGIATIDEFSVASADLRGIVRVPLVERAPLTLYAIHKAGRTLSSFAEYAIARLRDEVRAATGLRGASTRD
ncbi:LysR family transcriptional regulator [Amaricoccus macauensis]|uniref:LysR family transcriptional regulator n=1 Tax=Amaricoccus macauensis TaxID=57001 RepID=UPI00160A5FEA|nr:LysR family transcriptional regulator [Amaricoccus macauensis]